jgi:micrococcal nuclease
LLLVVAAAVAAARWWYGGEPSQPESLAEGVYQVQRVVDGDTLLLANGARIRLIGADTPETVKPNWPVEPWGPEATEFTKRFVAGGEVWLRFDRERQDRYRRFLAYVWVGDAMLNEELIRAGLATAEMNFRYSSSMKTRFRRAEQEARAAGRGIWSDAEAK